MYLWNKSHYDASLSYFAKLNKLARNAWKPSTNVNTSRLNNRRTSEVLDNAGVEQIKKTLNEFANNADEAYHVSFKDDEYSTYNQLPQYHLHNFSLLKEAWSKLLHQVILDFKKIQTEADKNIASFGNLASARNIRCNTKQHMLALYTCLTIAFLLLSLYFLPIDPFIFEYVSFEHLAEILVLLGALFISLGYYLSNNNMSAQLTTLSDSNTKFLKYFNDNWGAGTKTRQQHAPLYDAFNEALAACKNSTQLALDQRKEAKENVDKKLTTLTQDLQDQNSKLKDVERLLRQGNNSDSTASVNNQLSNGEVRNEYAKVRAISKEMTTYTKLQQKLAVEITDLEEKLQNPDENDPFIQKLKQCEGLSTEVNKFRPSALRKLK